VTCQENRYAKLPVPTGTKLTPTASTLTLPNRPLSVGWAATARKWHYWADSGRVVERENAFPEGTQTGRSWEAGLGAGEVTDNPVFQALRALAFSPTG
jgi:hypothetical protein